jgi:ABC-2 type transport system permease protein
LFSTQQQSATFGAVSIVILAALGGIWVPVYVMPESVRFFAEISPLYWSLSAFHQVFLGEGNLHTIATFTIKLMVFFILTISAAYYYNNAANKH